MFELDLELDLDTTPEQNSPKQNSQLLTTLLDPEHFGKICEKLIQFCVMFRENKFRFPTRCDLDFKVMNRDAGPIGEGRYAKIYDVQYGTSNGHIMKINSSSDRKTNFVEVAIQILIYCQLQEPKFKTIRSYYGVPKINCVYEEDKTVYIIMEKLDTSLNHYLYDLREEQKKSIRGAVIHILKELCLLLGDLQERVEFMHRDLHIDNVMLKLPRDSPRDSPRDMPRVGLIDFGSSRVNTKICSNVDPYLKIGFPRDIDEEYYIKHMYKKREGFNASLDMLTLLLSMKESSYLSEVPELQLKLKDDFFNVLANLDKENVPPYLSLLHIKVKDVFSDNSGKYKKRRIGGGNLHQVLQVGNVDQKNEYDFEKKFAPNELYKFLDKLKI